MVNSNDKLEQRYSDSEVPTKPEAKPENPDFEAYRRLMGSAGILFGNSMARKNPDGTPDYRF